MNKTETTQEPRAPRPKPKPEKKIKAKRSFAKKIKRSVKIKRETHGTLVKKAHSLIREIVMLRDGYCVCPPPQKGHSSIRQAGHIIRSTKGGSRFSLWNVHEQCSSCNSRHVRDWQVYQDWFERKFGSDKWLAVQDESKEIGLKTYELTELICQLSLILKKQKENIEFKPYYTQKEILSGAWSNVV
jgi:hypothetical protein